MAKKKNQKARQLRWARAYNQGFSRRVPNFAFHFPFWNLYIVSFFIAKFSSEISLSARSENKTNSSDLPKLTMNAKCFIFFFFSVLFKRAHINRCQGFLYIHMLIIMVPKSRSEINQSQVYIVYVCMYAIKDAVAMQFSNMEILLNSDFVFFFIIIFHGARCASFVFGEITQSVLYCIQLSFHRAPKHTKSK